MKFGKSNSEKAIKTRLEEIKPILEAPEPFTIEDIDAHNRASDTFRFLKAHGAIKTVGEEFKNKHVIKQWRWVDDRKTQIQNYIKQQNKLDKCGHRAHIHHDPEVPDDMLGCKFCSKNGDHPAYSKEEVKQLL